MKATSADRIIIRFKYKLQATSFYNTMTPSYSIHTQDAHTRVAYYDRRRCTRERPDNEHMLRVAAGKLKKKKK
uniref:Uncharacterized protein n=1 Tax=Trichogramma kaykai TaxID=54128 RepID=A0ABD2VXG8_9HYME